MKRLGTATAIGCLVALSLLSMISLLALVRLMDGPRPELTGRGCWQQTAYFSAPTRTSEPFSMVTHRPELFDAWRLR